MKQIPLSQGKFATVDDDLFDFLSQWKWHFSNTGYATRAQYIGMFNGKCKNKVILMHRLIANPPKGVQIDHISGDKLDNRLSNLRECNHSQNQMNSSQSRNGSRSKYKGIAWHKTRKKWLCQFNKNKKCYFVGWFNEEIDAALAYNFAIVEHFGEFARFNKAV